MRTKESNDEQCKRHLKRVKELGGITHSLNPENGRTLCNKVPLWTMKISEESNCLVCTRSKKARDVKITQG